MVNHVHRTTTTTTKLPSTYPKYKGPVLLHNCRIRRHIEEKVRTHSSLVYCLRQSLVMVLSWLETSSEPLDSVSTVAGTAAACVRTPLWVFGLFVWSGFSFSPGWPGTWYIAEAGLELLIFPSSTPSVLDYSYVPPHHVCGARDGTRASCKVGEQSTNWVSRCWQLWWSDTDMIPRGAHIFQGGGNLQPYMARRPKGKQEKWGLNPPWVRVSSFTGQSLYDLNIFYQPLHPNTIASWHHCAGQFLAAEFWVCTLTTMNMVTCVSCGGVSSFLFTTCSYLRSQ